MSELLWVAVPGGRTPGGAAVLRAVIVPRLDGGPAGTLQGAGLADWPALLAGCTLDVEVAPEPGAAGELVPGVVRRDGEQVQQGLWQRFFAPGTTVKPWQARAAYPTPDVTQTSAHQDTVSSLYRDAARAGAAPETVEAHLRALAVPAPEAVHEQPAPPAQEPPDFHRAVSLLREHPAVLRALGLIVEFTLPATELLGRAAQSGSAVLRIRCTPGPELERGPVMACPQTRYLLTSRLFLPAPRDGSEISAGLVPLAGDDWQFATFDVATGLDRLQDAARAAQQSRDGAATLPALRSAGISLLHVKRSERLRQRTRSAQLSAVRKSLGDAELYADDLLLGYRVDVRISDGAWASLSRRRAAYFADADHPITAPDEEEGQIKANGAVVDRSSGTPTLRTDEVVARWNGWSLVCPPPRFDAPPPDLAVDRAPLPFAFRWEFSPVGLPELRFGREYEMRIRVADLAGGGLTLDEPGISEGASPEVLYARHEPVLPAELAVPTGLLTRGKGTGTDVLKPEALGPGGMLDRLIVRSDPQAEPALPAESFTAGYPANDRRMLLPPPASFQLAEQHGAFDGHTDETCAAWLRRATAPCTYTEDGTYSWLPDPACEGVAAYVREEPGMASGGAYAEKAWAVPDGRWPDFRAKTVVLHPVAAGQAGHAPVEWTDNGATLAVKLEPGRQMRLELTSSLANQEIIDFEMSSWLELDRHQHEHEHNGDGRTGKEAKPGGEQAALDLGEVIDLVRDGRHPMVSPARTLHLVHAVRRPLKVPHAALQAQRTLGATHTDLVDTDTTHTLMNVDVASSAQLDLAAAWTEYRDDDAQGPGTAQLTEQVTSVRLDLTATEIPALRHQFTDTRHRSIRYSLTALTRFRDCFAPPPGDGVDETPYRATSAELGPVSVPSSARPAAPVVLAVTPAFRWEGRELEAGWQELKRARYGGRLRVELARPWYSSGEGERLAVLVAPPEAEPSDVRRPYVTRVRRDPIHPTPLPPTDATAFMFTGSALPPSRYPTLPLAEALEQVTAIPYEVTYQGELGRWCADIELPVPAAASYCPFVQLAVARYQEASLPGLELSTVVRTEMVQLLPDRTLHVRRSASGIGVLLEGLAPEGMATCVVAALEQCPPGTAGEFTTAGEQPLPGWQRVPGQQVVGPVGLWLAELVPPPGPVRLVVREVERVSLDAGVPEGDAPPAVGLAERTVFMDVIPLSP
ncbi:hypothetical protein ACWCXB_07810 [Streptomyces sp. NPDC001514]